jgi:hypothetical protein
MLHLFGVKLHPVIGIVGGLAAVAAGIALSMPMVCVVGAVMLFATATRWFGSHQP